MRVALFLLVMVPVGASEWTRVASPGIELLTDAGENTGRRILGRFEQIHRIFHQANISDSALPLRVFVFASEGEFHTYRDDASTDGFYRSGPERDYIAMHTGPDAERVAFHEYVHVILNHSGVPLPKWFEEGMAEFYSTLELDGGRLWVGKPIESHLAQLSSNFYAQSWALVHMLNLSPAWRDGLPQFVLLLEHGVEPEEAFRSAFGRTRDQAISATSGYVRTIRPVVIPIDAATGGGGEIKAARIPAIDAAIARADLALQLGRPALARKLLERLKADSPEVEAELAALAMAEDRRDDARRHLEHAMALGGHDAAVYFEYAMLERDSGAKPERVDQLLEKVVAVNPNIADAQFLLGVHASDEGNYPAAVNRLREAVRILPRRSNFWHALGYAQWKLGRSDDALESARRAVATAENADQEGMGEALLSLVREKTSAPPVKRPAVITPPSWEKPHGDASVEGILTRVDCDGATARLRVVATDGKTVTLEVKHPLADGSQEFSCGPQELRVVVEYVAATGEVTRLKWR